MVKKDVHFFTDLNRPALLALVQQNIIAGLAGSAIKKHAEVRFTNYLQRR